MVRKGLPACMLMLNICVWSQFEIKIVIVRGDTDINTTYLIWILKKSKREPSIIWKRINCQRITSKILDLDGSTPEPAIRSGDTGQRIPCFDSCQLMTALMCNQASSWAPKVARKCKSKHWYACGADGRSVTWLPNFLGWIDYLSYGAPPTRARSARVELRY